MDIDSYLLAALIFVAALLYSSVRHAGASGYLVAMALFGVAPEVTLLGGFIGAELGSRRLANPPIQKLLALVLVIAGIKMILTAW